MTAQGSAYSRFRRALDRGNVTDALSAASELAFVGLAEALELTLLLADEEASGTFIHPTWPSPVDTETIARKEGRRTRRYARAAAGN